MGTRNTLGRLAPVIAALLYLVLSLPARAADAYEADRLRMVADVVRNAEAVGPVGGQAGISESVLRVMRDVPRHRFVPDDMVPYAYDDRPLPIGYGQTISQPYIVALMTDLLGLEGDETVLEIGTGSGYQAAVLARLAKQVFTIEIVPQLAEAAKARLGELGFENATARHGDGYYGWSEQAPFDAIMVTAAAGHVPPPLTKQLRPGGVMVIPVGAPFFVQQLVLIRKAEDESLSAEVLIPVRFVPLTGDH